MALDRQDKALREFKQIMADLVHLLRFSTRVQLSYMCWVNHSRKQFVWETNSTNLPNVMFKDRVNFELHFLNEYKNIEEIKQLKVGEDVVKAKLMHYFDFVQAKSIILIPFVSKGETVALTVLESEEHIEVEKIKNQIVAYNNALVNVLETYLEVVDLHEQQKEWEVYEKSLNTINYRQHRVEILKKTLGEMQKCTPQASISLLTHGMETWNVVLNSEKSKNPHKIGLKMDEKSVAYDALEKGEPVFSMHFNNSPKRISNGEGRTEGATFAIPILVHDRRQGVIIVQENDPLVFKESTKHKLSNLGRTASLNLQSSISKANLTKDLITQDFGAYMPELWEATLDTEIKRLPYSKYQTFFGLISPDDISGLRTKFGLEELKAIQSDFITFLNPSLYALTGFMGYNLDYVYSFILQGEGEHIVKEWMDKIEKRLEYGLKLSNGHTLRIKFKAGFTKLGENHKNAYQLLTEVKKAHSEAINSESQLFVEV